MEGPWEARRSIRLRSRVRDREAQAGHRVRRPARLGDQKIKPGVKLRSRRQNMESEDQLGWVRKGSVSKSV